LLPVIAVREKLFGAMLTVISTARADVARRPLPKLSLLAGLVFCGFGCAERATPPPPDPALTIELRWVESYPAQRRIEVETGLLWSLSYLGATLPRDERFLLFWQGNVVTLRLDLAGIDSDAAQHWARLLAVMKASEEYRSAGAIDVGRFVALTLCSPRHYYALTGAKQRFDEARSAYSFDSQPIAIVDSSVSEGSRLIEAPQGFAPNELAFIAHEGVGSIRQGSFQIAEHEFLDVMPNGQLRFALYDASGTLKPSASGTLTTAGKPTKCLWCHESNLMGPFVEPVQALEERVAVGNQRLREARSALRSKIDFSRAQDHTYAELLYVAFYEPSAERIAQEWNVSVDRVEELLSDLPTHAQEEFPFLGDELYSRADVDTRAPHGVIKVPSDPREPSAYEPDLLQ